MIEQIGEKDAVSFYRSCKKAMYLLKSVADRLSVDPQFICRESIYYASDKIDAGRLEKEYRTLKKNGFPAPIGIGRHY